MDTWAFNISWETNLEFRLDCEFDDVSDYNLKYMEEFAIIFYDDSGELWNSKYLDVDMSSSITGDLITNAGFCGLKKSNVYYHTGDSNIVCSC